LIDYSSGMSIATIAKKYSTNRPLVERSIDRAPEYGPRQALSSVMTTYL